MTTPLSLSLDTLRSALHAEESLVVLPPAEPGDVEAFEQRTGVVLPRRAKVWESP
jgi:hypothetical protein